MFGHRFESGRLHFFLNTGYCAYGSCIASQSLYRSDYMASIPLYEIITTQDQSYSIAVKNSSITFHSTRGALQESQHIFIQAGLHFFLNRNPFNSSFKILEVGFGTGLNALLTATAIARQNVQVAYHAIDLHPLPEDIYTQLNYATLLDEGQLYKMIMQASWDKTIQVSNNFELQKIQADLVNYSSFQSKYDIVYFDAFAPDDQPEMWTASIFKKLYQAMSMNSILVTYSSKSAVRKAMQGVGFLVTKIPGPPGKREIIRVTKNT